MLTWLLSSKNWVQTFESTQEVESTEPGSGAKVMTGNSLCSAS